MDNTTAESIDNTALQYLCPVIETAIDYKTLYEQLVAQNATLQQELANLKRLIFGSKNERFIPVDSSPSQLSLDMQSDELVQVLLPKHRRSNTFATQPRLPKSITGERSFLSI